MKNTSLIEVLRVLTPEETQKLHHFLRCKAFNNNRRVVQLFDFVCQYAPDYEHDDLCDENAFRYINPDAKSDAIAFITKLRNRLLELVEDFIGIFFRASGNRVNDSDLLAFCNERKLDKSYQRIHKRSTKALQNTTVHDEWYYFEQFQCAKAHTEYLSWVEDKQHPDHAFPQMLKVFDTYYIVNKLYFFWHCLNLQQITQVRFELPLIEELLDHIVQQDYLQEPVIRIWYDLVLLLRSPKDEMLYQKTKANYARYAKLLRTADRTANYTLIENIASSIFDYRQLRQELFDLYKLKMADPDGIAYFKNGYMQPTSFSNMVAVALALNEIAWAAALVQSHKGRLAPNNPNSQPTYELSKALVLLAQKNYDESLSIAYSINTTNVMIKISRYRCLIKVYYEMLQQTTNNKTALRLLDSLNNEINNFSVFLTTNKDKLSASILQQNRNFNNWVNKLHKGIRADIVALEQKIADPHELIVDRFWLLARIKECLSV
jgi:hypothetical protein